MKTWGEMKQEVLAVNTEKGWWDKPVSFGTAMALLHSEVAEATHAYSRWGISDMTPGLLRWSGEVSSPAVELPKPEGVGSEFADTLIRLLDDDSRFSLWLDNYWDHPAAFGLAIWDRDGDFTDNMYVMHGLIAKASFAYEDGDEGMLSARGFFGDVVVFLKQLSVHYQIDLYQEYCRKLAFNKTRPYRHGKRV